MKGNHTSKAYHKLNTNKSKANEINAHVGYRSLNQKITSNSKHKHSEGHSKRKNGSRSKVENRINHQSTYRTTKNSPDKRVPS